MPLRLRVLAGPSIRELERVPVNNDAHPMLLDTPDIAARLCVRIRDFAGIPNPGSSHHSPYFATNSDLYSIQLQARFKRTWPANDIVFGNEFERKINLPPGSSIALKFVQWFDPGLEADIFGDQPWAYSPLVVTMNTIKVEDQASQRQEQEAKTDDIDLPPWPSPNGERITESWPSSICPSTEKAIFTKPSERRSYFSLRPNLQNFEISPNHVYNLDFFNPYIDFNNYALKLPVGFAISVLKYWDGQVTMSFLRVCFFDSIRQWFRANLNAVAYI